jgi:hypothetical protein
MDLSGQGLDRLVSDRKNSGAPDHWYLAGPVLVRSALGSFRRHASFPSEGAAVPEQILGVGWSDHWSFWQAGYRAIMVTDTAFYRYAHYHTKGDTGERSTTSARHGWWPGWLA